MLRPTTQRRAGWVPAAAPSSVADPGGAGETDWDRDRADDWASDRANDWDSTGWSDDDLLTAGIPDTDAADSELDDDVDDGSAERISGSADLDENALESPEPPAEQDTAAQPSSFRARRVRGRLWGRLAENWVPEPLRDARIDPGRRAALILSLVAALGAVAAAIGVWRDRPEPRPVQPVAMAPATDVTSSGHARGSITGGSFIIATAPAGSPTAPVGGPVAARPSSTVPAVIAVSVTGLVHRPGLLRLPGGSRVADAIAAAGGVAGQGDVTGLNLAAVLSDGDSVVVGARSAAPAAGSGPAGGTATRAPRTSGSATRSGPINLNTADQTVLESLPGVGPVMAGNILSWRQQNGSFSSIDQLQEVTGIGPSRYAQLAPLVTLG